MPEQPRPRALQQAQAQGSFAQLPPFRELKRHRKARLRSTWTAGKVAPRIARASGGGYFGRATSTDECGEQMNLSTTQSGKFRITQRARASHSGAAGYQLDTTVDRGPRTIGCRMHGGPSPAAR